MADQDSRSSFWTSLPGILTGAAALVTALSGLAIWHNKSAEQPRPAPVVERQTVPQPAPAVQPASQSQTASPQAGASTRPEVGSQPWCAEKYKAWADEKAQSGVDDGALRKAIVSHHCNTKYGFVLGRIKQ